MMSLMLLLFQASQMKNPMPTPPISMTAAGMWAEAAKAKGASSRLKPSLPCASGESGSGLL